jgi:thiamine-phosphate pyrophosphorylase
MNLVFPRLYAIIDPTLLTTSELVLAETLAESGVELIQYRNKTAASRRFFEVSRQLSSVLARRGVRFIVNDRPDIALLAGAGGVHVGQDDLGVEEARAICGTERWVGVSTHSLDQVEAADRTSADYIAFGPIFPTTTKQNPDAIVGTELLRRARRITAKPLVAIGGITLGRAAEVYLAGADSLAVVRDLICAASPGERAREYLEVAASTASRKAGSGAGSTFTQNDSSEAWSPPK